MKNLTTTQIFAIVLVVLGVLGTSTAQLTDLIGAHDTKLVVSASSLLTSVLSGVLAMITGQGAQVKSVLAMPGVENLQVNKEANSTLATLAVDPTQAKIEPTPQAQSAVEATAKAAS